MNCKEIRENLSAYQDGELGAAETSALEEHLASCEECRATLADYHRILGALLPPVGIEPQKRFSDQVMSAVVAEDMAARSSGRSWMKLAAAAAAFLVVAAGLVFVSTRPGADGTPEVPADGGASQISLDDVVAAVERDPALLDILDNLEELEQIEILESLPILERMTELQAGGADALAAAADEVVLDIDLPVEESD